MPPSVWRVFTTNCETKRWVKDVYSHLFSLLDVLINPSCVLPPVSSLPASSAACTRSAAASAPATISRVWRFTRRWWAAATSARSLPSCLSSKCSWPSPTSWPCDSSAQQQIRFPLVFWFVAELCFKNECTVNIPLLSSSHVFGILLPCSRPYSSHNKQNDFLCRTVHKTIIV